MDIDPQRDLVRQATEILLAGGNLQRQQMYELTGLFMSGTVASETIARLLTLLHHKGETVDELAGAALSLRQHMAPIHSVRENVVDTCGTGGSGVGTFNISTAAAIVAASAGASVAKHGNRRSTSRSGSSDVLEHLGVNIQAPLPVVQRCLDELGLCFCFAPLHHGSVRHVMEVRRSLPHPTIFNLLGPLCNPASAAFQLLGAGRGETMPLLAEALAVLGTRRALVVHSRDGIGELSASAVTDGILVENGGLNPASFSPEQFGLGRSALRELIVDSPGASARMIRNVLRGAAGPAADVVRMNAAVVLWVCGASADVESGFAMAEQAIQGGRSLQLLADLSRMTSAATDHRGE